MVFVSTVDGCAGGTFTRALVSGRGCACIAGGLSRSAFPACAAAMSSPAASASPAPLATLSALRAVAIHLTLFSACLDAGARLAARGRRGSAHGRFGRTRVDVPIPLLASVLIPVVLAPITITTVTAVASASLGAPAITVTAALTAL